MNMKKKGIVWDQFVPWIIGAVILVIGLIVYSIFSESSTGLVGYIKGLLRFGT